MKITEVVTKMGRLLQEAKIGRDAEHIENELIIGGSSQVIDALNELKTLDQKPQDVSVKWDGTMAIYWGNDETGKFYLVPKAQWDKSLLLDKDALSQEIQNTGRKTATQTDADFKRVRRGLAQKYLKLWSVFESASKGTRGFFKGDIMFAEKQTPDASGNYVFTPNKVTYTVKPNGLYGKMNTAKVFVTVHGKSETLGSNKLVMVTDNEIKTLNSTPSLIAISPQKAQNIQIKTSDLDNLIKSIKSKAGSLDKISNYTAPKFTTLKQVLYNYAIKLGKSHDSLNFDDWLEGSAISDNHKNIIRDLAKTPEWKIFWKTFYEIKKAKHDILNQIHTQHGKNMVNTLGITADVRGESGGEGYMLSSGRKLVNPHFRSAPDNPRFTGEI